MPGDHHAIGDPVMDLHGYWRSGTSYRVRIALNLKGVPFTQITHDLRIARHRTEEYRSINPQGLVPALQTPDGMLTQSPAILEWLEEQWPNPPLLPRQPHDRAVVRAMAAAIGCDIHPLNNMRVLTHLKTDLGADAAQVAHWTARWIAEGFGAIEAMVAQHGRGFAFGDSPTIADCYLVPQVYSAGRFNVDLTPYPALMAAADRARALDAFVRAHPDMQPDADG